MVIKRRERETDSSYRLPSVAGFLSGDDDDDRGTTTISPMKNHSCRSTAATPLAINLTESFGGFNPLKYLSLIHQIRDCDTV